MSRPLARFLALPAALLLLLALSGCTNPDAPPATSGAPARGTPQNAGEPPAPPPRSSQAQAPAGVKPTPMKALEAFAGLYVNWTYRTLTSNQRQLAGMSVGPARLAERQAAASTQADTTIARGHLYNTGRVVSVARDLAHPGTWVLVTREQTAGSHEYEGLGAAYHVTLAKLAGVPGGYAVKEWLPQN